jgi:hypothetical protein
MGGIKMCQQIGKKITKQMNKQTSDLQIHNCQLQEQFLANKLYKKRILGVNNLLTLNLTFCNESYNRATPMILA